jgi:predicted amidohydrolase YtcJ
MIVLARNLFEIPAEEIGETEVRLTVFNGQVVYAAG